MSPPTVSPQLVSRSDRPGTAGAAGAAAAGASAASSTCDAIATMTAAVIARVVFRMMVMVLINETEAELVHKFRCDARRVQSVCQLPFTFDNSQLRLVPS